MSSTEIRQLQLYGKLVVKELEKNLRVKEEVAQHPTQTEGSHFQDCSPKFLTLVSNSSL
jgi:hypothetical protein